MKIHFCDLCNESVPQAALDSGVARVVKDRVICAACDAAMSHGQPHAAGGVSSTANAAVLVPPAPRALAPTAGGIAPPAGAAKEGGGSNAGLAWIAGIAIGFTALSIFVTDDRLERVDRAQKNLEGEILKRDDALRGLAVDLNKVHPALAGVEARAVERHEAHAVAHAGADAATAVAISGLREDVRGLAQRFEGLALEVERLRARVSEPGLGVEIERRFDELSARLAQADDERRLLSERLAGAELAPAAEPAAPEAAPAAWTKHLADLKHADEGVRWDAVSVLGDTNDPAVVPHVLPMLADPSFIVRMAAARVLGEKLKSREAVPALITALEDSDSAVREAAWIALRAVTGKDLKFESNASEAERAKRVKAWAEWWKKEGSAEAAKASAGT